MLPCNVGGLDRATRLSLGALLLAVGAFLLDPGDTLRWPALALGMVWLVTGATRRCPLYVPFGISTRRERA